ncbi:TetR/AcrR family transcriptional regulator [Pendulispora brunnea]|uniref:TetR/AcrR family transcriptional regulator n=1 Tax=Pendulispora brunnea TaxID=2905690 RepID=A0ABZ2JX92_9BACT
MPAPRERPKQIRGEQLVSKIFEATLAELARVDFESLSMETVAERAGVNKSTLYRRWPTKLDLVRATLDDVTDVRIIVPDHGNLRADLMGFLRSVRDFCLSPEMQGIMRLMFGGRAHPDLAAVIDSIGDRKDADSRKIVERAIARGELPRGVDGAMFLDAMAGAVMNSIFFMNQSFDDAKLERLIEMVLVGAQNGGGSIARPVARAKRTAARTR